MMNIHSRRQYARPDARILSVVVNWNRFLAETPKAKTKAEWKQKPNIRQKVCFRPQFTVLAKNSCFHMQF